MKWRVLSVGLPLAAVLGSAAAHEGMWLPDQLPKLAAPMKAAGLQMPVGPLSDLLAHPLGAVVSLDGCSASFVSPKGLVVTNHHCVYGSLQYNSSPQRDLLKHGFLAAELKDELPAAPGTRVLVTVAQTDVTARVLDAQLQQLDGQARTQALEKRTQQLVRECEQDSGHRCTVKAYYGGSLYRLIKQLEIRDVRVVHAPAQGVGLFGGDTDNWMWPRHTGDYSFYRAYVGPDGKPADYAANNQPYQPKHHLQMATTPLREGDFVMVAGYPGSTDRYRLPREVAYAFEEQKPRDVAQMGDILAIIKASTAGRRDAEIRMANTVAGVANYYKNTQGQLASYEGGDLLQRREASHAKLLAWVQADPARRARWGAALQEVDELLAQRQALQTDLRWQDQIEPTLLGHAAELLHLAHERTKPADQRESGYQARDEGDWREAVTSLGKRYDADTDRALVLHFLQQYLKRDKTNAALLGALGVNAQMDEAALQQALTALYAGTQLQDDAQRLAWLERPVAEFERSSDSMVRAAVALRQHRLQQQALQRDLQGRLGKRYVRVMEALRAYRAAAGEEIYPDANSSLRVAFGKVSGRKPAVDGSDWHAFTTVQGIVAKHRGEGEFDAPAAQLAAIKARNWDGYADAKLGTVPVNFLATLDTTGGNSGSPVLNAQGQLVGLLFDGTLDTVISDWDFDDKRNRSICLDARYMLWQMKVVDKAQRLLQEMGVR
ncbi:S46 family peptidase [Roseateles sp. BYS180W]|uniref:Dipeptidyl-peptidase n=1 Tax=Roseateles rivi TaxID=3299028 RepID=A0ABW7FVS7_9BURK